MLFTAICVMLGPQVIVPAQAGDFTIDAYFSEWQDLPRFEIDHLGTGAVDGPGDLTGYAQIGFDAAALFFAVDVRDDRFVPGGASTGDRVFVRFTEEDEPPRVQVMLNTLEVRPPTVAIDGAPCTQCRAAGTMRRDGWAVEFSIPHDQLPGVDVGTWPLVVTIHDADTSDGVAEATVSTGTGRTAGPELRLDAVAHARAAYLAAGRTETAVIGRHRADIWGSPLAEEVHINGEDVVLLGQDLPAGSAYLYFTHQWRPEAKILRVYTQNLDGRPGREILVYRVVKPRVDGTQMEVVDVFGIQKGYLRRMFSQVVGVDFGQGRVVRARLDLQQKGQKPAVFVVTPETVEGVTKMTYRDPDPMKSVDANPIPLPWTVKRMRYRLRGGAWRR
jgi:hypothetical protein